MYVESNALLLQWFDYITFAGLIITYATVRLILYTCCTKQQSCFRQSRSGSLCEAKYGFSSQDSSDKGDFSSFPLDTSIVTFLTCMLGATNEVRHNGIQLIYLVAAHGLANIIVVEFLMPVLCDQRIFSVPEADLRIGVLANATELLILFVALTTILVFGIEQAGGVHTFWQRIQDSKLFNLTTFRFSPDQDYDLCSLLLGGLGIMLGFVTSSPIQTEQFALATSRRNARIKGYVCMVFCWPFLLAMFALGLLAFTILNECDPWTAGLVTYRDQLLAFSTSMLFDKMVVIKGWLLACLMLGGFSEMPKWLEREVTDRKVRGSNPTSASRLPLSRLGQPGSIPALVQLSGGMAFRRRKGATTERFFSSSGGTLLGLLISPFVGAGLLIYNVHFGATPRNELSLKSYVNCVNYSSRPLSMYRESEQRSGFNLPYLYVGSCNRRSPVDRAYMRLKYTWDEVASTHTLNSAETSDQFTDISLTMGGTEDMPTQSTYPRR
ncbi:Sodium-coupled monocarboxylate transporter 2 [Clonorchis sinensis]|uniref:Sodium-coupled monocarboxylate transporter 2 n=1 Tax=Clonorchis sinensis TaxID=79923 RepID=A0A3R7DJ61_CLOSI|nr:Sodium-coupled monocarboxylate transporter 2 [Clonorchis sinensis]